MTFIDTNVLVYAHDKRDRAKQTQALDIVTKALESHKVMVSAQVLSEFANVVLGKLKLPSVAVRRQLELLSSLPRIESSPKLLIRAVEIRELYGLSFWDAAIIAAAEAGGCDCILSEDLNAGQSYCGIKLVNPFVES